jgi:hypothetical protein
MISTEIISKNDKVIEPFMRSILRLLFLYTVITCLCAVGCRSTESLPVVKEVSYGYSSPRSVSNDIEVLKSESNNTTVISKRSHKSWKSTGILNGKGGRFRIEPDDYRDWGILDIRKGGSEAVSLEIVGNVEGNMHPVRLNERKQVIIEGLSIRGTYSHQPGHSSRKIVDVEYVTVSGLTISGIYAILNTNEHKKSPDFGKRGGQSNRLTFVNNILVERCIFENTVSKNAIKIHGKNVKIKECVIRNCYRVPGGDNIGISIKSNKSYQSTNIEISNNEIYNCTDGIQIVNINDPSQDNTTPNVSILNNDIYINEEYKLQKNGKEVASCENGIDLKTGGTLSQPVLIKGNFLRGFRETDSETGGSGGSGAAINLTINANFIEISDNIITDAPIGIVSASKNPAITKGKFSQNTIKNNLIYNLYSSGDNDGIAIRGDVGLSAINNTIVNVKTFLWSGYGSPFIINNNIVINDNGKRKWSQYHKARSADNIWINPKSSIYSGNMKKEQILKESNYLSLFQAVKVTIYPLTNPTTLTIPYGKYKGVSK